MRSIIRSVCLAAFALSCPAAELRVATLDLQRVLADYYKAQEAARELKVKEVSFLKELEGLRLEGRRLVTEAEDLRRLSLDIALSANERSEKKKSFEEKLADVRAFELRYDETKSRSETELQVQAARVHRSVLEDVLLVTRAVGDREGFNLILNVSKANPVTSDVLYAKGVRDVTDQVLASLNAGRPVGKDPASGKARP